MRAAPTPLPRLLAAAIALTAILGPHGAPTQASAAGVGATARPVARLAAPASLHLSDLPPPGLPRCGGGGGETGDALTPPQIAGYAVQAGLKNKDAIATAVGIALAESGGHPRAECYDDPQPPSCPGYTYDRGLWQFNSCWHKEVSDDDAFDPARAASAMARVSADGTTWAGAWATYDSGAYRRGKIWDDARAAADSPVMPGSSGAAPTTVTLRTPFDGDATINTPFGCVPFTFEPWNDTLHCYFHEGIDYALPFGTPVLAAGPGAVVRANLDPNGDKFNGGYGLSIVIRHGDKLATIYGHLSSVSVKAGDVVAEGQPIGASGGGGLTVPHGPGTDAGNSTGPHLHFGTSDNGDGVDNPHWVDPAGVIGKPVEPGSGSAGAGVCDIPVAGGPLCAVGGVVGGVGGAVGTAARDVAAGVTTGLSDAVAAAGNWFFSAWISFCGLMGDFFGSLNIWTNTPAQLTYKNPTVVDDWWFFVWVAFHFIAVWIACIGAEYLVFSRNRRGLEHLIESFYRIFCACILILSSLQLIGYAIEIFNGLSASQLIFDGHDILAVSAGAVAGLMLGPLTGVVIVLSTGAKFVVLLLMTFQMGMRIFLLAFAIVLSPLGCLCLCWPQARRWGQLWFEFISEAIVMQFLQVTMLHLVAQFGSLHGGLGHYFLTIDPKNHNYTVFLGEIEWVLSFLGLVAVLRLPRKVAPHLSALGASTTTLAFAVAGLDTFAMLKKQAGGQGQGGHSGGGGLGDTVARAGKALGGAMLAGPAGFALQKGAAAAGGAVKGLAASIGKATGGAPGLQRWGADAAGTPGGPGGGPGAPGATRPAAATAPHPAGRTPARSGPGDGAGVGPSPSQGGGAPSVGASHADAGAQGVGSWSDDGAADEDTAADASGTADGTGRVGSGAAGGGLTSGAATAGGDRATTRAQARRMQGEDAGILGALGGSLAQVRGTGSPASSFLAAQRLGAYRQAAQQAAAESGVPQGQRSPLAQQRDALAGHALAAIGATDPGERAAHWAAFNGALGLPDPSTPSQKAAAASYDALINSKTSGGQVARAQIASAGDRRTAALGHGGPGGSSPAGATGSSPAGASGSSPTGAASTTSGAGHASDATVPGGRTASGVSGAGAIAARTVPLASGGATSGGGGALSPLQQRGLWAVASANAAAVERDPGSSSQDKTAARHLLHAAMGQADDGGALDRALLGQPGDDEATAARKAALRGMLTAAGRSLEQQTPPSPDDARTFVRFLAGEGAPRADAPRTTAP